MKRSALVYILAIILICFCSSALAEESIASGECGTAVNWVLNADYSLQISGLGSMTAYDNSENLPPWSEYAAQIISVEVGSGITSLGSYSFYGCTSLSELTLPETLTQIGDLVFCGCEALTEVDLPSKLTRIGNSAFSRCSLTELDLPASVTYIGASAFGYNDFETIDYPATITSANGNLFWYCDKLRTVNFAEGVKKIPANIFYGCTSLAEVRFPSTLTTIYHHAFFDCALTEITLPEGLTQIREYAFYKNDLFSIDFPDSLTAIDAHAFGRNCLSEINLPPKIETLGKYAFAYNSDRDYKNVIDTLVIPGSLKVVAEAAFLNTHFNRVIIEEGVTTLENECLYHRNIRKLNRTQVDIPASVTEIAEYWGGDIIYTPNAETYAFQWATERSRLVVRLDAPFRFYSDSGEIEIYSYQGRDPEVTIPATIDGLPVTTLMPLMFSNNYLYEDEPFITKVQLPDAPLYIQNAALCNLKEGCQVHIPAGVNQFDTGCLGGGNHLIYTTTNSPAHKHWKGGDEDVALILTDIGDCPYTYSKNGSSCTITGYYSDQKVIEIPSELDGCTVTAIGKRAFQGTIVQDVAIPSSVTSVGELAFCYVVRPEELVVRIPSGIKSFGDDPFPEENGTVLLMTSGSTSHNLLKKKYSDQIRLWVGENFSYKPFEVEVGPGETETWAIINGYWGKSGGNIEVPDTIKGCHVDGLGGNDGIDEWEVCFPASRPISRLTLPEGIAQVYIEIESGAVSRVYMPESEYFMACVTADDSTTFYVYEDSPWHQYLSQRYDNIRIISKLYVTELPASLKNIAAEAFLDNTAIQYVEIPEATETIGVNAFKGCIKLQRVSFAGMNTAIAEGAFADCHAELVFECYAGSMAEAYASSHSIKCEIIE